MTVEQLASRFWGKAGRTPPHRVHPALFHMLDVGLVGRELVLRSDGAMFDRLAAELGLADGRAAGAIGFLVALHDLGKISPGFQAKVPDLSHELRAVDYPFPPDAEQDHSFTTQVALAAMTGGPWSHVPARAIAAHHGSFHPTGRRGMAGPSLRPHGEGVWVAARQATVECLAAVFDVEAGPLLAHASLSSGAAMVLAGLTTLADWIGSDGSFFPPAAGAFPNLASYLPVARERAVTAVEKVGWRPAPPHDRTPRFGNLFPGPAATPTPLQELAGSVARTLSEPGLALIEAPMGAGKTEAALYMARILANRFGHTGIYIALPSQATSNQMFGRFRSFVEHGWGSGALHLHLLHGLASFHDAYDRLPQQPDEPEPSPAALGEPADDLPAREARVYAAGWFRPSKRALLAPFGVGTVDQALLSVLPVRHMFLRLFGLANKVVILDEAHAYETYTTELLFDLVRWLRELGSTVIVLSATLPAEKRRELLKAYTGVEEELPPERYPRITWATPGAPASACQPGSDPASRYTPPPLHLHPWPEIRGSVADGAARTDLARKLAAALAPGGRAAWFCNTVASAQETYLLLDSLPELRGRVRLIHAQLPVCDRRERERRVETVAGKGAGRGKDIEVWVCTQVLEQSLDVDFDAMVSELAPMDLLLQRAGRLFRHERQDRPPGVTTRVLWWLRPAAEENDEDRPAFGVDARVYEPVFLLRTLASLETRQAVAKDAEIEELVEAVYAGDGIELPSELAALEVEWRRKAERREQAERVQAALTAIPRPDAEDPFTPRELRHEDEDDPRLAERLPPLTRLGDPTITIVPVEETPEGRRAGAPDARVDPDAPPADPPARREWERALLLGSVRLQHRGWVAHLAAQPVPKAWEESPVLRNCRPVVFHGGVARQAPGELRLDPALGLVRAPRVLLRLEEEPTCSRRTT